MSIRFIGVKLKCGPLFTLCSVVLLQVAGDQDIPALFP